MSDSQTKLNLSGPSEEEAINAINQGIRGLFPQIKEHTPELKLEEFPLLVVFACLYLKLDGTSANEPIGPGHFRESFSQFAKFPIHSVPHEIKIETLDSGINHFEAFLEKYKIGIQEVTLYLDSLDEDLYRLGFTFNFALENVDSIFEYWLFEYHKKKDKSGFIQAKELSEFCFLQAKSLLKSSELSIYNPFSGLCSYVLAAKESTKDFLTQEIDRSTYYLSLFRLIIHEIPFFEKFAVDVHGVRVPTLIQVPDETVNEGLFESFTWKVNPDIKEIIGPLGHPTFLDALEHWPKRAFDLVITTPPSIVETKNGRIKNVETYITKKSIASLKTGGVLAMLMPSYVEYSSKYKSFRKLIVQSGYLAHVIRMPLEITNKQSFNQTLFLLRKRKSKRVRFTDLNDDAVHRISKGNGQLALNVDEALASSKRNGKGSSVIVESTEIDKRSSLLTPNRYIIDIEPIRQYDNSKIVPLKQFLKPLDQVNYIVLSKTEDTTESIYIGSNNFHRTSQQGLDFETLKSICDAPTNRKYHQLVEPAILISTAGRVSARYISKDVLQNFGTHKIYVDSSISLFKEVVSSEVLFFELLNWKFDQASFSYRKKKFEIGIGQPSIRPEDLIQLKIEIPDLDTQRQILLEYGSTNNRLEESLKQVKQSYNLLEDSTFSKFEDLAEFKHNMAPDLLTVSSSVQRIHSHLALLNIDLGFAPKPGQITIGEHLNNIIASVDGINKKMDDLVRITKVIDTPKQLLPLSEVINSLKTLNNLAVNFPCIEYDFPTYSARDESQVHELETKLINTELNILKDVISQILKNANDHAFANYENIPFENRRVIMQMAWDEFHFHLKILNNGKPLPSNFIKADFVKRGYSSLSTSENSGIGGYTINRYATYLGSPNWTLINNPESEYPVGFSFSFPLSI